MEIERKWLVNGWPDAALALPLTETYAMEQGYISTKPTVRIRKEALQGGKTEYILCFKSGGGLSREEIELPIEQEIFNDLSSKILGKPLIPKLRRSYTLAGGHTLEVNEVDKGQPTAFYYAEIEFSTEAAALAWKPESDLLAAYLAHEVTHEKGQSMAEYWLNTRG